MEKKNIHMIGNTHIDPVWLWQKAEGMQEVKSSFASALDRLDEFPDFKFTQSSISFLAWMKENCPEQFERIRARVAEGRWEKMAYPRRAGRKITVRPHPIGSAS